jgi:GT2 family glycosyltransferase
VRSPEFPLDQEFWRIPLPKNQVVTKHEPPGVDNLKNESVVAIVVAWNRGSRIAESIDAISRQTRPVDEIIVVDNGSTDDTAAFLKTRYLDVLVVEAGQNLGHAGGAELGISTAMSRGHDWFWMFDDDAYPNPTALERSLSVAEEVRESSPAFVYAPSGDQTGWMWNGRKIAVSLREQTRESVEPYQVAIVDFNMTLVSRKVVNAVGGPRGHYFMMMWEPEYCLRAADAGFTIWVVPEELVRHEHAGYAGQAVWRSYYQTRNHVALSLARRSPRAVWWCGIRQARFIAGTILKQDQKFRRVAMRIRGLVDGVLGRMGRRVDPESVK